MTTELLERPSAAEVDDDEIAHYFCECFPDVALCGLPVNDAEIVDGLPDEASLCVVCRDLSRLGCERCGQ